MISMGRVHGNSLMQITSALQQFIELMPQLIQCLQPQFQGTMLHRQIGNCQQIWAGPSLTEWHLTLTTQGSKLGSRCGHEVPQMLAAGQQQGIVRGAK